MPRDSSGVYRLPSGNPVVPDTLIESVWANTTLDDVANALTGSLPRSGVAPMLAPLILSSDAITQPLQAASKAYVDNFLAYATGMPLGAITAYATNGVPAGWLLCNGQAVSRTTYAGLFTAIGTIYGVGDGTTTFNVPDLRDEFIRGLGAGVLGTKYVASFASHTHGVAITSGNVSADHTHGFSTGGMSANATHGHTLTDNGHDHTTQAHSHTAPIFSVGGPQQFAVVISDALNAVAGTQTTSAAAPNTNIAGTGISVGTANTDHTHSGTTGGISANHTHSVNGTTVGAGGAETVPQHMVMNYIIKAIDDAPASGTVVTVTVGIVAPATAPPFVGAMYVDQVLNKVYVATGTAASTDWSLLN